MNRIKVRIYDAHTIIGNTSMDLFIKLNSELTNGDKSWKFILKKSPYVEHNIDFVIPQQRRLELPIDLVTQIEVINNMFSEKRILTDGFILSKDKYLEYFVVKLLEQINIPRHKIRLYSGSGKPDIIVGDTLIEVTQRENQLGFPKFAEDYAKYKKYQEDFRLKRFILVHDAEDIQPSIFELTMKDSNVWVLDLESFKKYFKRIMNDDRINKKEIVCKPNIKSPLKRKGYREIIVDFDLSDKNNQIESMLHIDAPNPELLYIRDIRPEDLIFILEIALEYKDNYIGRNGFIDLLVNEKKRLFKNHNWQENAMVRVLEREFWFRPALHMGMLNGNYKITAIGEYLYNLWQSGEKTEYFNLLTYRFLKSPGIETFLKQGSNVNKKLIWEENLSKKNFDEKLCDELLKKKYFRNKDAGIRYVRSILSWMKNLEIAEWQNYKGFVINKEKISKLLKIYSSD